jgi:CheY-like chemotaxis protein
MIMGEPQGGRKKILVLDDEPNVVAYLETLLQDNGYDTVSAADGLEGMKKARSEKPDLITLDISMPEESGIRFYRELKEDPELAGIPVVVVTGVTGYGGKPEEFQKFISTRKRVPPPDGFVAKPIDREELLKGVTSLLS